MIKRKRHVRSGDIVKVIAGNWKGAEGKVIAFLPSKERVVVEGVGMMKKHIRRSERYPEGGIIQSEAPIHVSNLVVIHRSTSRTLNSNLHKT